MPAAHSDASGAKAERRSEAARETDTQQGAASEDSSWMGDLVSDLGFWIECIDMLDEQYATAAAAAHSAGGAR